MAILTDAFVWVIVSSIRTNRARCTLYKNILDIPDEGSVSRACSGRASLSIRQEVLQRMFEKVSRSLKYDSNFLIPIYIYLYIYGHHTDHFTPLALRMQGKNEAGEKACACT